VKLVGAELAQEEDVLDLLALAVQLQVPDAHRLAGRLGVARQVLELVTVRLHALRAIRKFEYRIFFWVLLEFCYQRSRHHGTVGWTGKGVTGVTHPAVVPGSLRSYDSRWMVQVSLARVESHNCSPAESIRVLRQLSKGHAR